MSLQTLHGAWLLCLHPTTLARWASTSVRCLVCYLIMTEWLLPAALMGPLYCTVATGVDCIKEVVYNLVKVLKVGQSRINTTHIRAFKIIFYINILLFPSHTGPLTSQEVRGFSLSRSGMGTCSAFSSGTDETTRMNSLQTSPRLPQTWYSLVWPPWRHQSRANNNRRAPVYWVGPVPGENTLHVLTMYRQEGFPGHLTLSWMVQNNHSLSEWKNNQDELYDSLVMDCRATLQFEWSLCTTQTGMTKARIIERL